MILLIIIINNDLLVDVIHNTQRHIKFNRILLLDSTIYIYIYIINYITHTHTHTNTHVHTDTDTVIKKIGFFVLTQIE